MPERESPQRPTPAEVRAAAGRTVPDILAPGIRLLIVGINPGLWSGAVGAHFARPGNRFFPALHLAGLTDRLIDASGGLSAADRQHLLDQGIGITNLVSRATARADELTAAELREGAAQVARVIERYRPAVVAVAGITAYRAAFGRPAASEGRQPGGLGSAELWVVPNPSGLNAHATTATLAAAYAQAARAAGLPVPPREASTAAGASPGDRTGAAG